MKIYLSILFFIVTSFFSTAQVSQTSIGSSSTAENFNDVKFDPADGGVVNVGSLNNTSTGNDCFITKLNSTHQVVWQKVFVNSGDDAFYKVIVCTNGDYVAIGQIYQAGIRRAFVCRINSSTGNLIWSSVSNNSPTGELFWGGIETANQNIALVGVDSYSTGQTNSFIVLLNSSGSLIWSKISSRSAADEFRTINQLPNGNLIVGGFYDVSGFNYNAVILEMNELSGGIISQNVYSINTSLPVGVGSINSIWPFHCFIKNGAVLFSFLDFNGYGSASNLSIYSYDQTTKNLSGNLYYHSGNNTAITYTFFPIDNNDFFIGQSFSGPSNIYISRVSNGSIVYDKRINNSVNYLTGADVINANNLVLSGQYTNTDADGYNLFSTTSVPLSASPCSITATNNLVLQSAPMNATSSSVLSLLSSGTMINSSQTIQNTTYSTNYICVNTLPVSFLDINAVYKSLSKSVLINWITSSEFNSNYFTIERSTDQGRTFNLIGTQTAVGTSNIPNKYEYSDNYAKEGENLYRLKQVDIDGNFKYSNIVSITINNKIQDVIIINPNPAKDFIFIKLPSDIISSFTISLINAAGEVLKYKQVDISINNPISLDLTGISNGLYFIRITTKDNKITTQKLVINN